MTKQLVADFSNPQYYNSVYIPLLHIKKRYVFIMGGAGSGKSVAEAQKEVINSYIPGNRTLCIRKVKDTLKESVYAEIEGVINDWGLREHFEIKISPMHIKNKLTGSDFVFRGIDDPEKIKSIRGVSRVWIEEATELKREDFNQIDLRLRGKKEMQITCTFNPIDIDHWLYRDFWQHGKTDDVEILHSTYLDNRFVGAEFQKVMERLKEQDYRMYEIYALGKWGKRVEGQVFEKFSEIEKIPENAKFLGRGLDFGYTNDPTAIIAVYQHDGGIILDEELYRTGMTNQDIVNFLKSIGANPSDDITADSSEPKSIEEIYRAGFNISGVQKGADSIMFGINLLKQQPLTITKRSLNLRKELQNYVWKKDKEGKVLNMPIDFYNHAIDAARYRMMGFKQNENTSIGIRWI